MNPIKLSLVIMLVAPTLVLAEAPSKLDESPAEANAPSAPLWIPASDETAQLAEKVVPRTGLDEHAFLDIDPVPLSDYLSGSE